MNKHQERQGYVGQKLLPVMALLFLSGCGGDEVRVVDVPPPQDGTLPAAAQQTLPPGHPPVTGVQAPGPLPGQDMRSQGLPTGSVSQEGAPAWVVPASWREAQGSAIRKGSFAAGANGDVDISVTAFPGSVGGLLQNVNRWRQQIGLAPVGELALQDSVTPIEVDGVEGFLVDLQGTDLSTLAGSVLYQGTSWFFKMTGPSHAVEDERAAFISFLQSVDFP